MHLLLRKDKVKENILSEASESACQKLVEQAGIHTGGQLPLPANLAVLGPVPATVPFAWGSRSETDASPDLRPKFIHWVRAGAIPALDDVVFKDVERRTRTPLVAESDEARFTGFPDLVALKRGLDDENTLTVWADTVASMDWKTQAKFTTERKSVATQATLQVVGFAAVSNDNSSPPVFFSDLATGVRCWIMLKGVIYTFHREGRDLTLEQGVRLYRYFIANDGRLLDADMPRASRAPSPATGGAGTGCAAGAAAGGGSSSGGSSSSTYRDVTLGKCRSSAGGGREAAESADVPSRDSSPSCISTDDVAIFKMAVAAAATALQQCGADLSGVYDSS